MPSYRSFSPKNKTSQKLGMISDQTNLLLHPWYQGGITCGAIDEPRKSSKAIDKRVIINFRNCVFLRQKRGFCFIYWYIYILVYISFIYTYIYIFRLTTRFHSSLYLPYWQFHMAVTTISRNTKVNEQKQQESQYSNF